MWTCYIVNLLYHELWTCGLCDLLSTLLYCEVWYVYRSYFRFRPLPVYFPHRTFVSDVSEIPISFPFPELPFSILFPIKNMKTVMVLVFTDRFRPFSSLLVGLLRPRLACWDHGTPSARTGGGKTCNTYPMWGAAPRATGQRCLFESDTLYSALMGEGGGECDCWWLVLKCYELGTRQHKMLNVNILRPSKHYFPKDIMIFGRRLQRTYLHKHKI